MLDCFKAQERVNGPKEQEDKTLRIKDTSGLHLYRVRPSHSFTPLPPKPGESTGPRNHLRKLTAPPHPPPHPPSMARNISLMPLPHHPPTSPPTPP